MNTTTDVVSPTAATSVFKVTLEDCMEKQKSRLPELEVPRIFIYLRDAFYKQQGKIIQKIIKVMKNKKRI